MAFVAQKSWRVLSEILSIYLFSTLTNVNCITIGMCFSFKVIMNQLKDRQLFRTKGIPQRPGTMLGWTYEKEQHVQEPTADLETEIWFDQVRLRVEIVPKFANERHMARRKTSWMLHVLVVQQKPLCATCLEKHYGGFHYSSSISNLDAQRGPVWLVLHRGGLILIKMI